MMSGVRKSDHPERRKLAIMRRADTESGTSHNIAGEFYTGRETARQIGYMLEHRPDAGCAATLGLQPGYAILGLKTDLSIG